MSFHIDPGDPPTEWEARAEMYDDRTPVEQALHMNAFVSRCGDDDQYWSVDYGRHPFSGFLVPSKRLGEAIATVLNEIDPTTIDHLMTVLVKAYHQKATALDAMPPFPEFDDDGYVPDYSDETDQYDPF